MIQRSIWRHMFACLFLSFASPALLAEKNPAPATDTPNQTLTIEQDPDSTDILAPHQMIRWHVDLTTLHAERPLQIKWTIRDFRGNTVSSGSTTLNETAWKLDYQPEKTGWYELNWQAVDSSGQTKAQFRRAFSVYPAVKSSGRDFRYGVCTHTVTRREGSDYAREIALMKALGIDIAREGMAWEMIQPTPGTWNYQKFDAYVRDMSAAGIELQSVLAYSPKWASTGNQQASDWNDWNKVAPQLDAYLKYVATTVERYKGQVHYWEIWNEPDVQFWRSSTQAYVDMFNAASRTIKEADPDAQVLNGGFAMASRKPNLNFQRDFVNAAERKYWNIWAYHDYQTFGDTFTRYTVRQANYTSVGATMPVWVNEGGFVCLASGGEHDQALTLVKKLAMAPALGVKAYFWYDLRDDGTDPKEPEHHFGLVRHDFQPKPAFVAYQSLIGHLGHMAFESTLPQLPAGMYGVVFRDPAATDQHVLVLWQEGQNNSRPIWIGGADKFSAIDDMMGNATEVLSYPSGSAVQLTDEPLYIRFSGKTRALRIVPMVTTPDKLIVSSEKTASLSIQVTNPGVELMQVALAAQAADGNLRVSSRQSQLSIKPGETVTYKADVVPTGHTPIGQGQIIFQLSFGGTASRMTVTVPYMAATAIPKCVAASGNPLAIPAGQGLAVSLDDRDRIHNLYTAEPKPGMRWEGPDDLSARARRAYDDTGLLLEVAVKDNAHVQHFAGSEVWQGDSIQLALSLQDGRADYLEVQFALTSDGKAESWIDRRPPESKLVAGPNRGQLPFDIKRDGTQTRYRIRIPWSALSLSRSSESGFRLNFIVNDDDGLGRKQWLQITPGIGEEKNPSLFHMFQCR